MKCEMSKKSETQTHIFDSICSYWKPHRKRNREKEKRKREKESTARKKYYP